mmetsp:Transcript_50681/g.84280  ORF Transcript_50681/g.84280 Transcript_50681/m.84280 type:complete len:424 (+) Transcript_50681:43-1314(+)
MASLQAENESLKLENAYLRESKLQLIKITAIEMERLRRFIMMLSSALRMRGLSPQNLREMETRITQQIYGQGSGTAKSNSKPPSEKEWKWKQKLQQSKESTPVMNKPSPSLLSDSNSHAPAKKTASLAERMKALNEAKDSSTAAKRLEEFKKTQHERLKTVKVTTTSKDTIASLFAEKIEAQKKNQSMTTMSSGKGQMLKEALSNPEPEKAAEVVESLGLFVAKEKTPDFKKSSASASSSAKAAAAEQEEESAPLEVLNMNNNVMMKKMSEKEKENMENLICDSMVRNKELKQVQMCNADIGNDFLMKILEKLTDNREQHNVTELWLESNPIGDKGMSALAQFIASDDKITIIKLYSNKKTISTPVLNELIDAMEKNETILKFVFDGFRFQHQKDKKEKYLRRNAEIARKKRNEEKKRAQAQT